MSNVVGRSTFDAIFQEPPLERVCKLGFLEKVEIREPLVAIGAAQQFLKSRYAVLRGGCTSGGSPRRKLIGQIGRYFLGFARIKPLKNHR
jgi:hypothetical protein